MRPVQCPRAAHNDVFEIRAPAAVQGPLEGLIRIQVHQTDSVLENTLGVSAGFVWIKFLIAISRVGRNGDERFLGRTTDADGEGLFYSVINHRGRQPNSICGVGSVRLSRRKMGFAEHHATRQRRTYLT